MTLAVMYKQARAVQLSAFVLSALNHDEKQNNVHSFLLLPQLLIVSPVVTLKLLNEIDESGYLFPHNTELSFLYWPFQPSGPSYPLYQ